jgi:hypothetical protein
MGRKPNTNILGNDTEERERFEFNREPDRSAHEIDTRERDDFYDLPEVDNFDYQAFDVRKLQLTAPSPRVDEKHGKMRQHWCAFKHNNGRRVQELMDRGYRVRRPTTVPASFQGFTEQWQMHDVIMVAGEHILMEIPEYHYNKLQRIKTEANNSIIRDIRTTHGQIVRDGEVQENRLSNVAKFSEEIVVNRNNSGGDISFAD